ncbi:hypothetical protein [Sphingosinicella soli]|uniref:Uncharacterized protein n=1 Tax=Sphingosinicella soli TaxID=333708 RepID=A0A7W7F8H4_9SPHN|nr:hypothetical protein [Sphingosinicella soli]MBB4633652.1 hypothetical protein [Sphingosinicella soli]
MSKRTIMGLTVVIALAAAGCGNNDDAGTEGEKAAVEGAPDASMSELGADASTADAMSVDVAAGGVEPMTDPALVDVAPIPDAAAPEEAPAQQ